MVAGMGRLGWLAAVLLLTAVGRCHDVVFSAARLKAMKGGFQAIESAHLYRIHEDGSGLKPLTAGGDSDTNPCLTSDGRRILFWRRDRNDLVGNIRLCSIGLNGGDFKILGSYHDIDLSRPTDVAHFLAGSGKLQVQVGPNTWGGVRVRIKAPGVKLRISEWSAVSPSGRYVEVSTEDVNRFILDLTNGKLTPLKGVRSDAGGTDVPEDFAWLDEHTVFSGFYAAESKAELFSLKTLQTQYFDVYRNIGGQAAEKNTFRSTQWATNPDGVKAFWYNPEHQQILFQVVNRSEDGGEPAIYCVRRSDGLIRFQIAECFLEDVKKDGSEFLTTSWKWGNGFGRDGATPLRKLQIWDRRTLKPRELGFERPACNGALPSSWRGRSIRFTTTVGQFLVIPTRCSTTLRARG